MKHKRRDTTVVPAARLRAGDTVVAADGSHRTVVSVDVVLDPRGGIHTEGEAVQAIVTLRADGVDTLELMEEVAMVAA